MVTLSFSIESSDSLDHNSHGCFTGIGARCFCPSGNEVTTKYMGKITCTKHNKSKQSRDRVNNFGVNCVANMQNGRIRRIMISSDWFIWPVRVAIGFWGAAICQRNPNMYSHIDGLQQDCSNSIANALELLQCCTDPSIYESTSPMTRHKHGFYTLKDGLCYQSTACLLMSCGSKCQQNGTNRHKAWSIFLKYS